MIGTDIEHLIKMLARLPGMGPRSARRAALHLLKNQDSLMRPLATGLHRAADIIETCDVCHNMDTSNPCSICQNPNRNRALLCVVEDISDLWAIEKTNMFKGYYHVLGGTLSALDGIGPDDLFIHDLIARVADNPVEEVILALNATIDGQTTSHYLADCLEKTGVKCTQLAHGVPMGGQIDYLDDSTLTTALQSRKAV